MWYLFKEDICKVINIIRRSDQEEKAIDFSSIIEE